MMIGNNIKKLRMQRGMTQKNLADQLFVSPQAVSRWENNEVEPSVGTITEMAKIFNVTTDEILGVESAPAEPTVVERVVREKEYVYKEAPPQVLAVCDSCKKKITEPSDIAQRFMNGGALCAKCKKAKEERDRRAVIAKAEHKRKLSYIWGSVAAGVLLLISIALISKFGWKSLLAGVPTAAAGFTFLSCLILNNNFIGDVVLEIWSWGFVKMPGIIFTLDIDGCLFFIGCKILFAILGFLIGLVAAVAAIAIGMVLSIFVYPFAIRKSINRPEYEEF
jgi:transcriptional regulator with XRE-family HTH domain